MKLRRFAYCSVAVILGLGMSLTYTSCKKEANELAHNHAHEHDHAGEAGHEGHEDHDHAKGHSHEEGEEAEGAAHSEEGGDEILLPAAKAAKLGVKVTKVEPSEFYEVVEVSGELTAAPSATSTVTARSAGIVRLNSAAAPGAQVRAGQSIASISGKGIAGGDTNEAARAALNAAKRELDRLTPLHADGIVSTRDYNAAKAAYEAARAAVGSNPAAGSSATAAGSGVITQLLVADGQYVEAGTPIALVSGSSALSLRANLPERNMAFLPRVKGAKFRTAYSEKVYDLRDLKGRRNASGSQAVAVQGYLPIYFDLVNDGTLSPGTFCEISLLGESRGDVISVPVSALSEQQGQYFVFVKVDADGYEKTPVRLGATAGDRVEILSGLKPGDEVVTSGTTFVRLAESSNVIPEGHSH